MHLRTHASPAATRATLLVLIVHNHKVRHRRTETSRAGSNSAAAYIDSKVCPHCQQNILIMVAISKLLNNGLLLAGQLIYSDLATPQQASAEQYNIVKFLGGSAPYVQHPGFGISTDVPNQCTLDQVHLLSRHGERYPSKNNGKQLEAIMAKFDAYDKAFVGELTFLNDYTYFVKDKAYYEKETTPANSEGTYAGVSTAYRHGAFFRSKYKSLFNLSSDVLNVMTSNSGRIHMTSRFFARGFMGDEYNDDSVKFYILSEDDDMGANSLTPRFGCKAYNEDMNNDIVSQYDTSYLDTARARILTGNEELNLTKSDVKQLFGWCAYEINVRGQSPFCDLFTNEEFIRYSYLVDLSNYYSHGVGNNLTATIATPYLQATLKQLKDENPSMKIVLGFTHDTDVEIYHAGLGLLEPESDLPTDHIPFPNPYVHSQIVPQGARLITEKYTCGDQSYVRFLVNDAVYPIKTCQSGPGFSCPLDEFESYINSRTAGKDYQSQCQTEYPSEVSFLWDYKTANYTAEDIDN